MESSAHAAATTQRLVGTITLLVTVATMAVDHLLGTDRKEDESGLADPAMFAISIVVSLAAALVLFGWLVPRERRQGPERAARSSLVLSIVSVIPGIALLWVGVPFVVAGAGLALGIDGRRGRRRVEAASAVAVGTLVLAVGSLAYLVAAIR